MKKPVFPLPAPPSALHACGGLQEEDVLRLIEFCRLGGRELIKRKHTYEIGDLYRWEHEAMGVVVKTFMRRINKGGYMRQYGLSGDGWEISGFYSLGDVPKGLYLGWPYITVYEEPSDRDPFPITRARIWFNIEFTGDVDKMMRDALLVKMAL